MSQRKIKKRILVFTLLLLVFRGPIFRLAIKYEPIKERSSFKIEEQEFRTWVENEVKGEKINDLADLDRASMRLTTKRLRFTKQKATANSNLAFTLGKGNCKTYSAFYQTIANELIRSNGLEKEYETKHVVGKMKLFGINLHALFNDPFFRDHDYNQLINIKKGKKICVDPSLADYFWIERVNEISN